MRVIGNVESSTSTVQDAPGAHSSRERLLRYPRCSAAAINPDGDHAFDSDGDVEDDVDAATPVDAENAPTGVWKSRKGREIPTAPTSLVFLSKREEERRTKPLISTVH